MDNQPSLLENPSETDMDLRTPPSDEAAEPPGAAAPAGKSARSATAKFLYPTGSKPLEGYTIKRGVGRGGFGEVYFATSDAGKEVALKLIRRNLDVEIRGVTHCLNLKHNNLIGIHDIRTDSLGDQWVVMEYVSGESLEEAIDRHPNGMPVDLVLRWMRGIGAGVAYLHDHGIVHRDLKPGNVFLDDDFHDAEAADGIGTVKIGDYGLSKFISCSRRSGQTESVGTVHYMAPEIANGRYGREIDTYALGIILYEMLTGHVPFEGESVGEVLMKHLTAEPKLDMLDDPYREIVERTLAKDPEVRIGSVNEMLALLPDGKSVGPLVREKVESWSNAEASSDGIGSEHLFQNTSVRGRPVDPSIRLTPVPSQSQREPLYEWLSTSWSGTVDSWYDWPLNPVGKALLLFCLVGAAVVSVGGWGPVAAGLAVVYLFYYVFWTAFVQPSSKSPSAKRPRDGTRTARPDPLAAKQPAKPQAAAPTRREQTAARRRLRMNWRDKVNKELVAKPFRKKATELLSSMVLAGIVCTFLSLLAVFAVGAELTSQRVPLHLWLSVVSTVSCWAILATSKFTEGRFEDRIPARMMQLVAGAGVGLLAYGLTQALMIGLPYHHDLGSRARDSLYSEVLQINPSDMITTFSRHSVAPDLLLSVLYFSLMFLMLRWWRLAEYTRRTRLSLVNVGLCICGAWIAHLVCWYPQPAGVAVAGVVAVATQLVSPWLPPSARKAHAGGTVGV